MTLDDVVLAIRDLESAVRLLAWVTLVADYGEDVASHTIATYLESQ